MRRAMVIDLSNGRLRPMRPLRPRWTSAGKGWDGFLVEEHAPTDSTANNVALVESAIYLPINGRIQLEWQSGRQSVCKELTPGQVSILPANHPYSVRLRAASGSLVVSLSERLLTLAAAELGEFGTIQPVWVHGVEDGLIRELVMTLREELRGSPDDANDRYARSLASTLAAHIVRRYSTDRLSLPCRRGGLALPALRRVIQFVQDNLEEDLTLERLASQAGMSTCHFARMFKNSTGMPPHRYVLNCRIGRAKQLLLRGTGTLAVHEHLAAGDHRFGSAP